jgi:hypothetical protein
LPTTPRRWTGLSSDRNGDHRLWEAALMPDLDLIKMVSTLGVGGLLACVIFIYYRLDFLRERQNHQAERDRQAKREERLLDVIERNAAASERLAVTIEILTRALEREGQRT